MNTDVPLESSAEFKLGVGTGSLRDETRCNTVVKSALEFGYRHIDSARHYGNESAIGKALKQSKISRSDVFVATKVHSKKLAPKDLRESINQSATSLGVETIDLVYVHWPAHAYDPVETLSVLSELKSDKVIRHIGLSNVTLEVLKEAQTASPSPIFAIQVEMHPFLQQRELHEYTREQGIWLVAHTPLCQGAILQNETLSAIANKYAINEAQLTLAWLFQKKLVAAIPGGKGSHLKENYRTLTISLNEKDIREINQISEECRCVDYDFAPW